MNDVKIHNHHRMSKSLKAKYWPNRGPAYQEKIACEETHATVMKLGGSIS